jgi:hypothetical protein
LSICIAMQQGLTCNHGPKSTIPRTVLTEDTAKHFALISPLGITVFV